MTQEQNQKPQLEASSRTTCIGCLLSSGPLEIYLKRSVVASLKALSHQVLFDFSFLIKYSFWHSSKPTNIVFSNTSSTMIKYQIPVDHQIKPSNPSIMKNQQSRYYVMSVFSFSLISARLVLFCKSLSFFSISLVVYLIVVKTFLLLYQDIVFQMSHFLFFFQTVSAPFYIPQLAIYILNIDHNRWLWNVPTHDEPPTMASCCAEYDIILCPPSPILPSLAENLVPFSLLARQAFPYLLSLPYILSLPQLLFLSKLKPYIGSRIIMRTPSCSLFLQSCCAEKSVKLLAYLIHHSIKFYHLHLKNRLCLKSFSLISSLCTPLPHPISTFPLHL
ncbi:hypothetical protein VP01_1356g2 [Puccinia sorghi]|uniref:Uncharacterized protein n=1 Tax=Puccinia sorghi TaxID=27349 RepID=A0A0L6VNP8_9BASI|nr:hypothetical protein VP01_1356g2 [Puccinia sorghi]